MCNASDSFLIGFLMQDNDLFFQKCDKNRLLKQIQEQKIYYVLGTGLVEWD
jgi:hypothetical protein